LPIIDTRAYPDFGDAMFAIACLMYLKEEISSMNEKQVIPRALKKYKTRSWALIS
jgi:hypothetical protein